MKITYTLEAIDDLVRLRAFIADKNPQAAQRVAQNLQKKINQLKTFPLIGVGVEGSPDPEVVRDLITGHYIVRYLLPANQVHILRIWHHKEGRL